jgi:TP901 family phage tail tape measure protein
MLMGQPLQALRINTNIPNVTNDFDKLIAHINTSLEKPFDLNLNMNQTTKQFEEVNKSIADVKEQLNGLSKNTSNNPILDSTQTKEQGDKIVQIIEDVKKDLSSLGDVRIKMTGFDEETKQFKNFIATVDEGKGKIEQFKGEMAGLLPGEEGVYTLTPKSTTDNSQAVEAKQLIKDENVALQETKTLLTKQYQLETDLNTAKEKGKQKTIEELTAQKELNEAKIGNVGSGLSDSSMSKVIQQASVYQEKLNTQLSSQSDKQTEINAKVEKEVSNFKILAGIKLQNLESTGGGALKNTDIQSEITGLKELKDTMTTANFSEKQGEWNNKLKETQADIRTTNEELKNAGGFASELGTNMTKIASWAVSMGALYSVVNAFKDAVTYTNELNKSMTNIEMITTSTSQQATILVGQYRQMAASMGQNDSDFLKGAEEYLRAGLSEKETATMLKENAIASAISGVDNATMSEDLIAMKNGYNLSANEVDGLIDKISTLDNKSSASFEGIADGMKRSAASAKQTGISYQTLASYITTVIDVTHKSADTIGENFKTIFSRMTNVKAGMTDEDNLGINDVEKVLDKSNINIKLRATSGEWRNMGTVIDEIASKWKSFDGVTQSQIATVVAGRIFCPSI